MNRTLRRPMFRMGGTTEGITSGLAPRQGYKENGSVKKFDENQMLSDYLRNASIGDVRRLSKEVGYKPRGASMSDFLIDFGLDIASRPPSGSIFSTAAAAAKDPFSRYTGAKQTAAEQQYASESDMFKTMLGAQADILSAESGEGMAGKTEQWKFEQIPGLVNSIAEIEAIPEGDRTPDQRNKLKSDKIQLGRLEKEDPFLKLFLSEPKMGLGLFKDIKSKLMAEDLQSDDPRYDPQLGEDDPQLIMDAYKKFKGDVEAMGLAEGGRVGYQIGGDVMPGAMPTEQATGPTDQGPTPEDMAGITYEELRARLPQEVSDDIVRLLANSAEALEDFAMIQTEQDINTFNKKYSDTLVLPSEG